DYNVVVYFSDDGALCVGAAVDGVRMWHADGSDPITLQATSPMGTRVCLSPDENFIAATTKAGFAVWDRTGRLVFESNDSKDEPSLIWSADSNVLVTTDYHGPTRAWSVDGKLLDTISPYGGSRSMGVS